MRQRSARADLRPHNTPLRCTARFRQRDGLTPPSPPNPPHAGARGNNVCFAHGSEPQPPARGGKGGGRREWGDEEERASGRGEHPLCSNSASERRGMRANKALIRKKPGQLMAAPNERVRRMRRLTICQTQVYNARRNTMHIWSAWEGISRC